MKESIIKAVSDIVLNAPPKTMVMNIDGYDWVLDDHYPYEWYKVSKRTQYYGDVVGKGIKPKTMLRKVLLEMEGNEVVMSTKKGALYIEGYGKKPSIYNDRTGKTEYF